MPATFQAGKILIAQQQALSNLVGLFDQDPQKVIAWLSNPLNKVLVHELSGALNFWAQPAVDPLERARARQRVSQNCLWVGLLPDETSPLIAKIGEAAYHVYGQFYTVGGTGSVAANEQPRADSPTGWSFVDNLGNFVHDVNQAADDLVEQRCFDQQRPPPPAAADLRDQP